MPRVSLIIATHSRPHLLPRAIASAFNAGSDVEVIVVDDASDDQTAEVCRGFPDIRYVRLDRNQRVAGARNVGILASTGDYITFLDDDDFRLPGSLDIEIDALKQAPGAGMVYGQANLQDQLGRPLRSAEPATCPEGDVFWLLLEHNFIHCLTAVFRKECLLRIGLVDSSLPGMDDWDLWVRIAELYPVVAVNQPVGVWRSFSPDSDQGSARIAELFTLAARVQQEKWLELPRARNAPEGIRQKARDQMLNRFSDVLISHAAMVIPEGYSSHARKCITTALRLHPTRALRPWTLKLLAASLLPRRSRKGNQPTLDTVSEDRDQIEG